MPWKARQKLTANGTTRRPAAYSIPGILLQQLASCRTRYLVLHSFTSTRNTQPLQIDRSLRTPPPKSQNHPRVITTTQQQQSSYRTNLTGTILPVWCWYGYNPHGHFNGLLLQTNGDHNLNTNLTMPLVQIVVCNLSPRWNINCSLCIYPKGCRYYCVCIARRTRIATLPNLVHMVPVHYYIHAAVANHLPIHTPTTTVGYFVVIRARGTRCYQVLNIST